MVPVVVSVPDCSISLEYLGPTDCARDQAVDARQLPFLKLFDDVHVGYLDRLADLTQALVEMLPFDRGRHLSPHSEGDHGDGTAHDHEHDQR